MDRRAIARNSHFFIISVGKLQHNIIITCIHIIICQDLIYINILINFILTKMSADSVWCFNEWIANDQTYTALNMLIEFCQVSCVWTLVAQMLKFYSCFFSYFLFNQIYSKMLDFWSYCQVQGYLGNYWAIIHNTSQAVLSPWWHMLKENAIPYHGMLTFIFS